ncbi:MAG: hypothetical protein R3A46_00060 [Thermomicrobiales bacterium]
MGDLPINIWDLVGLALGGVALYMLATRVLIPRFGGPRLSKSWVSKREQEEAADKAEQLLKDADLDDETRFKLQRCLNTIRANDSGRESWSGNVPMRDIVEEIEEIWSNHPSSYT